MHFDAQNLSSFHAPVSGRIVHAGIVKGPTFGYDDWANLMPSNHNPAQVGTDFSQFKAYQRGVVIIEVTYRNTDNTPLKDYVASIPVGLDTIGSVVLDPEIKPGAMLKRGYTRIGNFNYGGSMNLMLFRGLAERPCTDAPRKSAWYYQCGKNAKVITPCST